MPQNSRQCHDSLGASLHKSLRDSLRGAHRESLSESHRESLRTSYRKSHREVPPPLPTGLVASSTTCSNRLGYAIEAVRHLLLAPSNAVRRGRSEQPGDWDLDFGSDPSEFISLVNEFDGPGLLDRSPSHSPPASLSYHSGSLLG